jgi:hypothetical protein
MGQRERGVDVSRRDLFGVLGGVASVAAASGCASAPEQTALPEPTGRATEAVLTGSSFEPAVGSTLLEIRFPITAAAVQTSALCLPAGGIVTSARLDIVTPYSAGTTIEVGKNGAPSQLIGASDNNPQGAGLYVRDQDTPWGQIEVVVVTVSGSPIAGAGFCIVQYTIARRNIANDSAGLETSDPINRPYATWCGALNLPSTSAITLTQGGTIASPAVEFPLVIQPRNPLKAPFQLCLQAFLFHSTIDDVLFFGYNVDAATGNEPFCRFAIEDDYESSPGIHQLEFYMECAQTGSSYSYRPFSFVMNRTTGELTTALQYTDALYIMGGPKGGPSTEQIKVMDGLLLLVPSNYVIAGSNDLVIESIAGGLSFSTPAGDLVLDVGAGHTCYFSFDAMQIRQANAIQSATIDNNVGSTRFYPTTDNTGSLGIDGQAWSTVFTHAINLATAPAVSATAGSGGASPAQVAGYLPITVNGTSYVVPLYNP